MYRAGHVGVALLCYSPLGFLAAGLGDLPLAIAGAVAFGALSLLPDVDEYLPLGHRRGVTHTVWFAVDVGVVVAGFGGARARTAGLLSIVAGALFGFLVGTGAVLSHVAADALTAAGVEPTWPLDGRTYAYRAAWASSHYANYGLLAVGIWATALSIWLGVALTG